MSENWFVHQVIDENVGNHKVFFDVVKRGDQNVMRFNERHPFFEEFYSSAYQIKNGWSEEEIIRHCKVLTDLFDLLFMAYAKAESMFFDPERFEQMRHSWGVYTDQYMKELMRAGD